MNDEPSQVCLLMGKPSARSYRAAPRMICSRGVDVVAEHED